MGLINKQLTKSKVAAKTYPTSLANPKWALPEIGRIVRAAAAAGISQGTTSSSFRGSDTLGIFSTLRSGDSSVWVENPSPAEWTISLGLLLVKGRATDWKLSVGVLAGDGGSPPVEISTPEYLTEDGALVHKDEYMKTREIVEAGLAAGVPPNIAPELDAGLNGLARTQFPLAAAGVALPFCGAFAIATTSGDQAVAEHFSGLPFPRQPDGDRTRFLFGLDQASHIDVTRSPSARGTVVDFAADLRPGRTAAESAVTALQATRFVDVLLARIRGGDSSATVTGDTSLVTEPT